jgi:2,3-bisphosphoglycerate-independent phosphoglycerate mutase
MGNKVALIILDGWGIGVNEKGDAIKQASTPNFDSLLKTFPNSTLDTFGDHVGLPFGQMGNSEVGHLNIGAGRVVFQELLKINNAINSSELRQADELLNLFNYCKNSNKPLHLMGLVSDGGVHSHTSHLVAIAKFAYDFGLKNIFIHAFTDGRDTDPKSGKEYIADLIEALKPFGAKVVSAIGRYYAMDRDKRWERIAKAYRMLIHAEGEVSDDIVSSIKNSYINGVTDEFLMPIIDSQTFVTIKPNDAVLCFNFRTDRCREITQVLTQSDFPEYEMKKQDLYYVTMTVYDEKFSNVKSIFNNKSLINTLGDVLSQHNKTQLRAAETEKYPHVTFFFNGGREEPFEGESRIMVPSPKVATYDLQPEMSAIPLSAKVSSFVKTNEPDFVCLNFANTDMVGHTGVFEAVMKAASSVDTCLGELIEAFTNLGYVCLVTADHGNADYMINEDGSPNTAHSKNQVPFIVVNYDQSTTVNHGKLADIAPTVLQIMNIDVPNEMNGKSLIN